MRRDTIETNEVTTQVPRICVPFPWERLHPLVLWKYLDGALEWEGRAGADVGGN